MRNILVNVQKIIDSLRIKLGGRGDYGMKRESRDVCVCGGGEEREKMCVCGGGERERCVCVCVCVCGGGGREREKDVCVEKGGGGGERERETDTRNEEGKRSCINETELHATNPRSGLSVGCSKAKHDRPRLC